MNIITGYLVERALRNFYFGSFTFYQSHRISIAIVDNNIASFNGVE